MRINESLNCYNADALGDHTIGEYCVDLPTQDGAMLVPASMYGTQYRSGGHFRIGFGRKDMAEGLEVWEATLSVERAIVEGVGQARASSRGSVL